MACVPMGSRYACAPLACVINKTATAITREHGREQFVRWTMTRTRAWMRAPVTDCEYEIGAASRVNATTEARVLTRALRPAC